MALGGWKLGGVAVAAFLVGVGCSYLCFSSGSQEKAEPEARLVAGKTVKEFVAVKDPAAQKEISALEEELARLRKQTAANKEAPVAEVAVERPVSGEKKQPQKWYSFRENLERMKTEDPKRYAELQARFKRVREMMQEKEYSRAEFLTSIDPAQFTPRQKEAHEQLLDLMERINQLRQEIGGPGEATQEQREEMMANYREMSQLLKVEQRSLLSATAKSMGFEGEDVRAFTSQIQEIIQATSMGFRGPGHGMGRKMNGAGPMSAPRQ